MKTWLHKCLLIFSGICLVLALLKIHGKDRPNTYHDDDDTYIQSDNQDLDISSYFEKQKESFTELNTFISRAADLFFPNTQADSKEPSQKSTAFTPPSKLFL